jgi:hypothetical protein
MYVATERTPANQQKAAARVGPKPTEGCRLAGILRCAQGGWKAAPSARPRCRRSSRVPGGSRRPLRLSVNGMPEARADLYWRVNLAAKRAGSWASRPCFPLGLPRARGGADGHSAMVRRVSGSSDISSDTPLEVRGSSVRISGWRGGRGA